MYLVKRHRMRPRVMISYQRQPFEGILDYGLRLTIDTNLTCRGRNSGGASSGASGWFVHRDPISLGEMNQTPDLNEIKQKKLLNKRGHRTCFRYPDG